MLATCHAPFEAIPERSRAFVESDASQFTLEAALAECQGRGSEFHLPLWKKPKRRDRLLLD